MSLAAAARRLAASTLARFVAVGVLNTVFSLAFYAVLVLLGLGYRLAVTVLFVVTMLWNFQTIGRLVFGNRRQSLIFKFVVGNGLIYLLNLGLLVLLDRAGVAALAARITALPAIGAPLGRAVALPKLAALVSQAIALPAVVACSFVLNRWWVFRDTVPLPPPGAAPLPGGGEGAPGARG